MKPTVTFIPGTMLAKVSFTIPSIFPSDPPFLVVGYATLAQLSSGDLNSVKWATYAGDEKPWNRVS